MPEEISNKPILNKAERRRVLNFKIIRHSKHYSERDKAEQNAYYWIEAAPGVMFHHGFSATVIYPFNPTESGKDNNTVYDKLCYSRVSRENPQRQKHQRHDN